MHVIIKLPSSHPSSSVTGSIIRLLPMQDFENCRSIFSVSVSNIESRDIYRFYLSQTMVVLFISMYVLLSSSPNANKLE